MPHARRFPSLARFAFAAASFLVAFASGPCLAQSALDGFRAAPSGAIHAIVVQPDGRIIAAGDLVSVNGQPRSRIARLHRDGSTDASFVTAEINGTVRAVVLLPDGSLLIGGAFTQIGAQTRNRLARLTSSGSLDTTFPDPLLDGTVSAIERLPDGRLLVGGAFLQVGLSARSRMARFAADGTLDAGFDPVFDGAVRDIVVRGDGKAWVGGAFGTVDGQASSRLVRLGTAGEVDLALATGVNGPVEALALQGDGALLVGGDFTQAAGQPRSFLARLEPDGSLDAAFQPPALGVPSGIAIRSDASIAISTRHFIDGNIQFTADVQVFTPVTGAQIGVFSSDLRSMSTALGLQADDYLLLANDIGALDNDSLYRVDTRVRFDRTLELDVQGFAATLQQESGGSLLVAGPLTSVGGITRNRMARMAIGHQQLEVVDIFNPNVTGSEVQSVVEQPDGMIVIGGNFSSVQGVTRINLARLHPDSVPDAGFLPSVNGPIDSMVRQPDGKLVIAGSFTAVDGLPNTEFLARLGADGVVDASFPGGSGPNARVVAMALQPDGALVIGGEFSEVHGTPRSRLARIGAGGALDPAFDPAPNAPVLTLLRQPDGKLLLGGGFTLVGGQQHRGLARVNPDGSADAGFGASLAVDTLFDFPLSLALQADGKILVGGLFDEINGVTGVLNLARLHQDGSLDTAFDADANGPVLGVALQQDGKVLLAGGFSFVGPTSRDQIARLSASDPAGQVLSAAWHPSGGTEVTWLRSGTAAELQQPPLLQFSIAGSTFADVGTMERIAGGWRYRAPNFSAPLDQAFYLRARAPVSAGRFNGSSGMVESRRQFIFESASLLGPLIFQDGFE
jgi:uncharacterized delta-60 repeat protein